MSADRPFKIFTVVGARPQFIKAAALSRCFSKNYSGRIEEIIIHTGQHYDTGMSEVFFEELEIPSPAYNIQSGSGMHGLQTARMLEGLEAIMLENKPDAVLVYGDTNSTLAGALAASKAGIPLIHVEAGLRSFNKAMPEEINRILTDHVSSLLFSPTPGGIENLRKEGFRENSRQPWTADEPGIFLSGDVMYDNALFFKDKALNIHKDWFQGLGLKENQYILATVHRNLNTDQPENLKRIIRAFAEIHAQTGQPVFWPLHPRTRKMLTQFAADDPFFAELSSGIWLAEPQGYLHMVLLESACSMVMTDSGGVQKEAYFYQKPCVVLRSETEWTELLDCGAACLADPASDENIAFKALNMLQNGFSAPEGFYGSGDAAGFIAGKIALNFSL